MSNKARMVNEPYSGNALKLKQELENSINKRPTLNEAYLHEKGFKCLINSRGYVHIWLKKRRRVTLIKEPITYYLIVHYRVTVDSNLHELGYTPYADRKAMERDFEEI